MTFLTENNLADILGVSLSVVQKWRENGTYPGRKDEKGRAGFFMEELSAIPEINAMLHTRWDEEKNVIPLRDYTSVELFAGAGGLALGMHMAGFRHVLLNEFDHMACETLRKNHPEWNVYEGDVHKVDFTPLRGHVDFLSGGFPCQAFSYAGKKGGLNDTRGTLFFELARAVRVIQPKVFMAENVKGLLSHEEGKTLKIIKNAIAELGYTLVEPRVLKAILYQVPQKRERLILVALRNDIAQQVTFRWPDPYSRIMTLRDAFYKGILYPNDVPASQGQTYPEKKAKVLALVPQGGDWRNLPEEVAKEFMGGSFYLGGGKTGMARRLSLDDPSLTLTCSPAQKQTERCHPLETRPLTVREYARIQTFPDNWVFAGSLADQYKQIGNAVPVNLAYAIGRSLIRLFNELDANLPEERDFSAVNSIAAKMVPAVLAELDLFALQQECPDKLVQNDFFVPDTDEQIQLDESKNLLVSLVKADNFEHFIDGTAKVYYTGHKFPTTVALNRLFYFMPYLKGKGIRDLYFIRIARVGTKAEVHPESGDETLRLVFEIEYVTQLFEDYQRIHLDIWNTYTDTTLEQVFNKVG